MTTTKDALEPILDPCRCGRKALIERFYDGDDPQPLFVATCEICPVKTYDQFTAEEAARIWNEFVFAKVAMPDGQWQHVQIKAGNPRVVAIQFETPKQATAFINSFAAAPAPIAPVVDDLLESEAFYELMQAYRHAGIADQNQVVTAFEAVKAFIRAPASPTAPILHCSCGATCTPDEYAAHRAMGHDAPAALRDEAVEIAEAVAKELVSQSLAENSNDLWQRAKGAEAVLTRLRAAKRVATTPPSTLARKAAVMSAAIEIVNALHISVADKSVHDLIELRERIEPIIERCFAAEK